MFSNHLLGEASDTFSTGCSIHPSKVPDYPPKVPKHPLKVPAERTLWPKSLTQPKNVNPKTSPTVR